MSPRKRPIVAIVVLVAGVLSLLGWQRQTATRLRREIVARTEEANQLARLVAEEKKLIDAQVSSEEMEKRRAERAAVSALLLEIEAMKRRAATAAHEAKQRDLAESAPREPRQSLIGNSVPASRWTNAGRATPDAAFETALWAAGGGDIESLAGLLAFDEPAQTKAEAIFANLPPGMKQELATPQRLIALLVAKDAPLGSAQIVSQSSTATGAQIDGQLMDEKGKSKQVRLSLRPEGDSWRFIVPPSAVDKYAAQLQAPPVTP
jgi:hypothetical protein